MLYHILEFLSFLCWHLSKDVENGLCSITWSSITIWQSYLLAQPCLTYLPLSLTATNRQAPFLRATQSDWLSLWVGSALPYWLVFPLTDPRKTPECSWKEDVVSPFIQGETSYRKLIFQSLKFHPIKLLYRQGCHHATGKL